MKRLAPGAEPSAEELALLRPESRVKLISTLVRFLQEEERVEARASRRREVRR